MLIGRSRASIHHQLFTPSAKTLNTRSAGSLRIGRSIALSRRSRCTPRQAFAVVVAGLLLLLLLSLVVLCISPYLAAQPHVLQGPNLGFFFPTLPLALYTLPNLQPTQHLALFVLLDSSHQQPANTRSRTRESTAAQQQHAAEKPISTLYALYRACLLVSCGWNDLTRKHFSVLCSTSCCGRNPPYTIRLFPFSFFSSLSFHYESRTSRIRLNQHSAREYILAPSLVSSRSHHHWQCHLPSRTVHHLCRQCHRTRRS